LSDGVCLRRSDARSHGGQRGRFRLPRRVDGIPGVRSFHAGDHSQAHRRGGPSCGSLPAAPRTEGTDRLPLVRLKPRKPLTARGFSRAVASTIEAQSLGTKYVLDAAAMDRIRGVLRAGGLLVYPTDTAYGLGADPFQPAAIE